MRLTDEEEAMRAGDLGPALQWAIAHQVRVGRYLGARDFVEVSQAHVMADTESLGAAGVAWLESLAGLPAGHRRLRVPTTTDPAARILPPPTGSGTRPGCSPSNAVPSPRSRRLAC